MDNRNLFSKIIISIVLSTVLILIVSCGRNLTYDEGIEPQKPFTFDDYYQDGMVLQHSSDILFTGTAESGVVIVISINDDKDDVVMYDFCTTDETGNWELSITSPKISDEIYSIEIYDSFKKYSIELNNIRFGYVFLIMGEDFLNDKVDIDLDYQSVALYENGQWYSAQTEIASRITAFSANLIKNNNYVPIGIIQGDFVNAHLGSWINPELVSEEADLLIYINRIYDLLIESDNFNDSEIYKNFSLWNDFVSKLANITVDSLIWYQGITDYLSGINFSTANTQYANILSLFVKDLNKIMNIYNTYLIQTPSYNPNDFDLTINIDDDIASLREAQATAAYFNKKTIIPTYEIGNNWTMSDLTSLVELRVFTQNSDLTPSYANCIITESKVVIEFSNCKVLGDVPTINNLKILDNQGHDIKDELTITIRNNQIIILRAFSTIDDSGKLVYIKYNISSIFYNYAADNSEGNLFNENNFAISPFKIILNEE